MNYTGINTAILKSRDIPKSIPRDNKFYSYLLNNNVAYYYCQHLSKEKNAMEKRIIKAGEILNSKFFRTVELIDKVCKEKKIKFLLFKTYKYFSEIVDGDIDLFIKEQDFYSFIKVLEDKGFKCFENEHLKAVLRKEGFCNIEPRVSASFHGQVFLNEKKIWEKIEEVRVDRIKVFKATKEIDLFYLLLEVLYRPSYLKLYLLLLFKNSNIKKLYTLSLEKHLNQDLKFLLSKFITSNVENKSFPLFIGDIDFTIWWFKRIFPNTYFPLLVRLKHILFFFYSKYAYVFFNQLVFRHEWPLN